MASGGGKGGANRKKIKKNVQRRHVSARLVEKERRIIQLFD